MKQLWVLLLTMLLVCCMAFGAAAESDAVQSGTNDLDGSKIEGVKVIWVTQDSRRTAEGTDTPQAELDKEEHLYLSSVSNGEVEMVYRIEAEFSGQFDYAPGDITITIPAQVWHARKYEATDVEGETVGVVDEDRLLGYLELPVPAAPSKKADFNWQIIDGNYVLTNTRTIGATSSVSIEVGIRGIRPVDVVDMSETEPITAHVEVVTNQGNTIELTSTPITAQLDTQAKITGAYKDGELFEDYPGLDEKLLANLPEGTNPEDYIYVRWYTYHSHNNNQPYSLDIEDVLSDAYEKTVGDDGEIEERVVTEGIFLGSTNYAGEVLTDGEIDFTAEIGDHFAGTTTGNQYANTVYMWSAYKKDAFEVPNANEPQRVYYFENEVTWTLTETDKTVEDAGNGKGEDIQKVTTAKDEVIVSYAPVKWQRPRGAFAVNKWTERVGYKDWLYGYAINLLESREEVDMDFIVETVGYGYPWTSELTKNFTYGELNSTVVNGDLDKLELDAATFGKLGWKQVTDDFQTFFNFETVPLTSEDFEFKSLRVSVPQKMRYAKKSNGTWDYVTDSKLPTPDLVIEYQLNNEDIWYPAATATWGEDGLGAFSFVDVNEAAGVTTSGMTVYFPENVTDVRHTFVSNVFGGKTAEHCDIAMLDWYVYPTITMKSSDRVYSIVQELFEQSENPATKFKNDVIMDAYGWVDEKGEGTLVLDNDFDYSMATYEGASYGVSLTKSGESKRDVDNQRVVIHYTATLTEQSNLKERSDYDEAVEAGVIPAETSGIWYDLLPPHVVPLLDTVKLRKGDTITNVYTVENYKDTGRTLLVVEAELTPAPTYSNSIGYADRPTLEFDAAYPFMDLNEYGGELVNYVAFESTVEDLRNDTLGTIKNQKGDPDTPVGGNNANTPSMPEDIIDALTDLDPNTDENRFVYGKTSNTVSALAYAVSGLQKAVKNDLVGIWTQGLDGQDQVTVYEGHYYTYSLRVSSAENTATKGIVIYDTIENYIIPDPTEEDDKDETKAADFAHTQERKDWSGDWQGKGQWRGTLVQVDLSEFVNAGVKPVLLYSTIPNLQFADSKSESTDGNFDEDTALFSSGSYDIADREIWQVAELDEKGVWQVPEGLAVTAVAIDATKTVGGEEFVLKPEEALAGYLKMRAPDDDGSEDKWNAKGAYARLVDENGEYILDENGNQQIDWEAAMNKENNMYAYNNARVRLIQGQANEGGINWLSNLRMIRNDYTRVGIVPEIITVEKVWQDQNDHDAMRPESVTIHVLRRLAGTEGEAKAVLDAEGQPLTAVLDESNDWKAEFKQVDIVNEDGIRYLYTFEEEPVEGYTSKVQFIDVNHYTMTNVHPNEQVEISGVKVWDDDNNALGFRPETVTLKLYRDGKHIDTRTVKANGAGEWVYTFGKLDKYAEGGKEYVYKVEEEYVPKYVGESEGYELVNNTFVPVGSLEVSKTLVNATAEAKKKVFTFTLVLLAEQTDPDAPAVPLMEKYPYTIYTLEGEAWVAGDTGEIGNSGTFQLKENQKIVVENLPSEATYEVIETEAAGFTSTATNADGSIRAGQTAQAAFVNEYKASGAVQLNVGKSLTGHAIRKNQFRFELVDNNPDSATYGEVIRTARVEAPEEGATTGGSGVEAIESLTQAIFGQLEYTQADDGQTYNYQVREVDTGKPGYTADEKVYDVAVTVADNGDGTMTITPTYTDAEGNPLTELKFENTYEASGELTLKAWKTLEGRELKDGEFTFELWSFDPETEETIGTEPLDTAINDAEGNVVFDALTFDQNSVSLDENEPATYTYLIREKQGTDKTVAYSNQEYVITVTVFDNGDGTLSFAQGSQKAEREIVECPHCLGTGYEKYRFILYETNKVMGGGALGGWTSDATRTGNYVSRMPFCIVCNGTTRVGENWCDHCGGSGIELGGTFYFNYNHLKREYVILRYENTRTVSSSSTFTGPVVAVAETETQYKYLQIDNTSESGKKNFVICPDCNGAGVVPGKLTITGDATMPVFANTLKPGDLTVTKLVEGEGSSNPDQTFDFTIKLTGEVPEELDYGFSGIDEEETTTPTKTSTVFHATPEQLKGNAYAVLNEESDPATVGGIEVGEMVLFRAEDDDLVDPFGNKFTAFEENKYEKKENGLVYYRIDEQSTSNSKAAPWYNDDSIVKVWMADPVKPMKVYFWGCGGMVSCDLSLMDTSLVTSMYNAFCACGKLEELNITSFDTSNVTSMTRMFYYCQSLKELDLSSFDVSNVEDFFEMFRFCYDLTKLDLSSFKVSATADVQWMLMDVPKLVFVDLHGFPDMSGNTNSAAILCRSDAIEKVILGEDTAFASTSYYNYPEPPTTAPYDGTWLNIETGEIIDSSKSLFEEGDHPGTWIWNKPHYTVIFDSGEGVGSSGVGSTVKELVFVDEGITKSLPFYNYGYDLVAFTDESGKEYPYTNGAVTIPANAYADGSTVTLTAVWEKRDVTVSESGDSITFALKAGETFTLSDLPASLAYEVWEELPTGWVLVEKKDDTGVIQPLETSEAVFTNKYEPTQAQASLRASKTLDGKAPAGEFSFTLSEGGEVLQTKQNNGSGVSFDTITYDTDDVGTHTYTIAEVKGNDTTINYDATEYTVTVVVTDDGEGNLSAEVTYNTTDGQPPVFENTTKPGGLSITKAVTGTLTDKAKEQAFTFEISLTDELLQPWSGTLGMGESTLTVTDGKANVTIKGGESVTLTDIPAGLRYEVQETGTYDGWTMDGTVRSGVIEPIKTAEASFTNEYSLTGSASIKVKKVLLGRDLENGEFTFRLMEGSNVLAEVTNGADGSVLFPQMEYTEEGEWVYTIVEVRGDDNTVEYSDEQIEVTVTTKDEKGDGNLNVTVEYSPEEKIITNELKPGALAITKTLVSSNPAHAEKEFTFTVTLTDAEGAPLNGTYTLNDTLSLTVKDGKVEINLKGGEMATISKLPAGVKYSVTEAAEAGFTTEMTGESGTIMPNDTAKAAFTNTYAAEGEYVIEASKTLEGADLAEGQFTFELTMPKADGTETVVETVTNDAEGKITFSKLTFTDQTAGEYVYRIREVNDRKPGFTYDDTVYEFTLIVKDNSDGTMTITPEGLPEGGIEFKNTYNDKTSVSVEKVWADEDDKLGVRPESITVELYRNGEKLDEIVLNEQNAWKHTFSELDAFDAEGVTYTYTVKELPVAGYDGMQSIKDGVNVFTNTVQGVLDVSKTVVAGTDAEKEFAFTVTLTKADSPLTTGITLVKDGASAPVIPDNEGKVSFDLKDGETARLIGLPIGTEYKVEEATEAGYTTSSENAEGLIQRYEEHKAEFTNTYEARGSVIFFGAKTLEGRELAKGEFSFILLDKDGDEIETVKNTADGKITFTALEYVHNKDAKVLGEHTYTVKEEIPEEAKKLGGVTYTEKTYEITVNVSDNGDGTLSVTKKEGSDDYEALNFVNTYEATGEITFEGTKSIEGRAMTDKDIFTFEVSDGTDTWTVQNDATGKIAYPTISYTLDDVGDHTYTVKETSEDGKGITVDVNSYTVTVEVEDKGDGTLSVTKKEGSDDYEALNFVNTYEATGEITFEGTKSIEGRAMTDKDIFTFEVSDGTDTWTVQNDATGKIAYPTINYTLDNLGTHTYTVKETSTDGKGITVDVNTYTVTVDVEDKGDGTLSVTKKEGSDDYEALNFVNTYTATGEITFEGTKSIEGRAMTDK
ncbi:MAG: Cna B-type domain-containing protein, partial [Clostridia bacterium]|nr:Cna B-type domain-containing protein [Clostridia bacterium]